MFPAALGAEQRLTYLDGWRGVAILGVLVGHYVYAQPINLGRVGVELFFVLSGRLMAELLFVRETSLRRFFPRRITRVYPALLVFCILSSLASTAVPQFRVSFPQFLSAVTFTYNYFQVYFERSQFLDHIWSLCVEEHCYILLGLLAFVHRRFKLPIVLITAMFAALAMTNGLIQTLQGYDYFQVYWRTDVRGASILLAVSAYLAMQRGEIRSFFARHSTLVPGLAALGLMLNLNFIPDPVKYSVGTMCFAIAIAAIDLAYAPLRSLLSTKSLVAIGVGSYSLYLWQQPFFQLGWNMPSKLMFLPLALVAAWVSFRYLEHPVRRYLNNRWDLLLSRRPKDQEPAST